MRVHLDTDLGTDPDDACALALLLGWPDVELVGITTSSDPGGWRAAYVEHCLRMLGRADIAVVAGAEHSLSHDGRAEPAWHHWPDVHAPRPATTGSATQALLRSVDEGAVLVAVGPYTNLAVLEREHPGTLGRVRVVVMGGWVEPPGTGLPAWGPERDHNVAWDTRAAQVVLRSAGDLTLSTLTVSLKVPLRARDLAVLRTFGPMGELLARQSGEHGHDSGKSRMGQRFPGLPGDLVNLHYDPLACAVAVGWPGAVVAERRLRAAMEGPVLRLVPDPDGRPVRVVEDVDGEAFTDVWLSAVRRACARTG